MKSPGNTLRFSTKAIHAGQKPDPLSGAVMTPVYLTSTYVQDELGKNKGYEYSRVNNPTRDALEANIAALENGRHGMAFGSGMAAIDAIFRLLKPGDHVIVSDNVYGGTYRIGKFVLEDYGLQFDFVNTTKLDLVKKSIKKNTRMLFIETPTNPTMEITDLSAIARLAKQRKLITICDNTFATPYLQRPIEHGIDVVVHSLTKYLNGHSDMLGGIVVTNNEKATERLRFLQKATGGILSPFDAWLCLRGTKTLAVRMERHGTSAMHIAQWLTQQEKIHKVHYPGLSTHPQYKLARRQMKNFGGMISFDLGSLAAARKFLKRVRLCALAESLGGVETLISHPVTMTHASIPAAQRRKIGVTDGLVRISVGLEDVDDIIDDLEQALRGR
ncbi:MAG: PLP-dependent transferase [Ignavibacteriae bacterium]|nr:PLP-dependent transferase [Ignavibacteria bacterium]MBI3364303.1 PLP-dependent transferase [Ignavibacteriota bacterium]